MLLRVFLLSGTKRINPEVIHFLRKKNQCLRNGVVTSEASEDGMEEAFDSFVFEKNVTSWVYFSR